MHHLIKVALVALATVAAYFVYGFTAAVAPWPVAVASAGSLVGTYLGLAFADIPARQRERASRVALGAMLIEACYGTLYVRARVVRRAPVVRRGAVSGAARCQLQRAGIFCQHLSGA